MDVLVVGAGGLLGSNLVETAINRELSTAGSYHSSTPAFDIPLFQFDVQETGRFEAILDKVDPSTVVNCAALTDVDACENHPNLAQAINADAPKAMAYHCSERDIDFTHISTDYIFDGKSDERYHEESAPNPIQTYGESKLEGDQNVRVAHSSPLLVRPSFVYGVNRSGETSMLEGFPAWVRSQLTAGADVPLFVDQHVTPSRAGSTAEVLLDLVDDGATGTYNIAAQSCVTPYEFGHVIAEQMGTGVDSLVKGSQSDVDRPAARPTNTCLDIKKVEAHLGRPQPTVTEDVHAIASYL